MGKKGFNWKARQVHETKVDDSETSKLIVDLPIKEYGAEDSSNAIALPSSKRHTKVKKESTKNIRILSKQQRKKLEKIVEKKQKKENRAALLEALAKVQIPSEELIHMTSISAIQSKGLKKNLKRYPDNDPPVQKIEVQKPVLESNIKIKSISGAKKRKYLLSLEPGHSEKKSKKDLNVVGLEEEQSSSDSDDSESENNETIENCEEPISTTNDINNGNADCEIISDNLENAISKCDAESDNLSENINNKSNEEILIDTDEIIVLNKKLLKKLRRNKNKDAKEINKNKEVKEINKNDEAKEINKNKEAKEINKSSIQNNGQIQLPKRETVFVEVNRDSKIQAARLQLPILAEEQAVVECINNNAFVLIAGETGSGKTTQVPQFLYEAGYTQNNKLIGITEPRRVAAVAMSERVATEMKLSSRDVSYLMRYEGNVTEDTQIKFMTDGVLLKEIETDFMLSKYSVIIIDEAHERSVFTDILIGLLSRIVPLRCKRGDPLRMIIMSATLRIEDFTENTRLFKIPPPVIKIEARQYPVTIHFNKRTEEDYLKAAFSKAIKIHTKLPEGGILIFVTGQQEVNTLVRKLRQAFPFKNKYNKKELKVVSKLTNNDNSVDSAEEHSNNEEELDLLFSLKKVKKSAKEKKKKKTIQLPEVNLDDFDIHDEEIKDDLIDANEGELVDDSGDEEEWEALALAGANSGAGPLWVLPLYSMLPPSEQAKVFQPPPEGSRVCIIATNVAETSLTIPNIKYVVDTGKQKIRVYEKVTGASAMRIVWVSQASAQQRAGRAGRCAPGHCYRLYSSAVFQHDFPKDKDPEIKTRPVDDLLLQMKCMGIDKVVNFPFPSAPDILQLKTAELRLDILGALEKPQFAQTKKNSQEILKVTPLGHAMAGYPVLPRYGKMLALSHQHGLFEYTICIVAALSVQEVLISQKRKWTAVGENLLLGDPGALLHIVGAAEHAALSGEDMELWCSSQGVRWRALREIRLMRGQLAGGKGVPPAPSKPPGHLARPLRQIILAGLGDCVARKVSIEEIKQSQDKIKYKYAYHCADMEEPVFIHSASALRKELPEWVVYQELYEAGEGENAKMIIRGITAIEPEWLPVYVPKLCNLGEPLTDPCPRYDSQRDKMVCHVNATFSRSGWQLPVVEIDFPMIPDIFRWFSVYLLDGLVIEKLKKYTNNLLSPPNTMIKSWARIQPRTEMLYRALMIKQICDKKSLLKQWEIDPSYLLDVYQKWMPESAHDELALFWPPIER